MFGTGQKVSSHLIKILTHPSVNKLWLIFMGMKQIFFFWKKPFQNGLPKKTEIFKTAKSRKFFAKISWIGPWISSIDLFKRQWCGSTYMVVRLSDVCSKTGKKCIFCVFRQSHDHVGWATSMPFASIYTTNPRTNPWNFCEKFPRIAKANSERYRWNDPNDSIKNMIKESTE